MSVKEKEEFATTLVHMMHELGKAHTFLCSLVMTELQRLGQWALGCACHFRPVCLSGGMMMDDSVSGPWAVRVISGLSACRVG